MTHAHGNQLISDEGTVIAEFPSHWAACAAMIQITDQNFRSLGKPTPFEEGWVAGLIGIDPRLCPFEKMTKEWHEWQSFHGKAVTWLEERRTAKERRLENAGKQKPNSSTKST